ncbi:hypothetical protein R6Q57_003700 [Mikania cordata]
MSRCFPFPPPGYEKKLTTDDPNLLKKEKRREKKHKKDKKDREKKEGKEKREKSRSEGKNKEKKDKHQDKKKDKEKSETSTPNEKIIYGQYKGYNGESFHHNNEQNKEKISSTDGKKPSIPFPYQNGDLLRNKIKVGDSENFKFLQEMDRRFREEKGTGSQLFVFEGRKNNVNNGRQVVMNVVVPNRINGTTPPPLDNRIENFLEKGSDDKQGDDRKYEYRDKQKQGKDIKEKSEQKKTERALNKHIMKSDLVAVANKSSKNPLENSFLGVGNEGNLKKRKDMEINGDSHENEPRPNKMARAISNVSLENGWKLDLLQSLGPSLLDKQGASHGATQNSFKVGSNGSQRVNGMLTSQPVSISAKNPSIPGFSNVWSKPSIKSPPVITNHLDALSPPVATTKSQPNHIASHHHSLSLSPPLTTGRQQPISGQKPPPAVVNKVAPPPLHIPKKKPPHPDTKYLNQILSVPKLDQWCGLDGHEWLVSSKARSITKKPPVDEFEVQVWSEAKHIESVDICALPYVIPY